MINLTREEAQQLLNQLVNHMGIIQVPSDFESIELLRAKLSAPEQKDDGYCQACEGNHCTAKAGCVALSNPPQREWQGLTASERGRLFDLYGYTPVDIVAFCDAIEAKLKEKNV